MSVKIRRITEDDLAAVAAVQVASALVGFAHIFPADAPKPTVETMETDWRDRLFGADATGEVGFVATVDGRVVGAAIAGVAAADPTQGEFARLYVHPDHWAGGVGRQLYDAALAHLAAEGFDRVRLKVLEANVRAREWYERLGWQPTGERDLMYERYGIVEVGYARELGDGAG